MGGQPIPVTKNVNPGETFDFQVNLVAPVAPGTYQGFWNMRNAANDKFGETVWVGITVPGAATPTPAPTQTPSPNITFTANPTTITAGQPVTFHWSTSNVKAVYFYHDGQNWQDHGVPGVGQSVQYPPNTMNYYLRVINPDNSVTVKTRTITVNQPVGAPVINQFSVDPPAVTVGQCVNILWQVSGQVSQVTPDHQRCDRMAECAGQRQLSRLPGHAWPVHLSAHSTRAGRVGAAAGDGERECPAAAAAHGDAGAIVPRAGDQWLHAGAEHRLTRRLHDRFLDNGRRHDERGSAARQQPDL